MSPMLALTLLTASTLLACAATNNDPTEGGAVTSLAVPDSLRREHEELQGALIEATRAPDPVGEAARELASLLHPHFMREEEIALPPLALLRPLAQGEVDADMRRVLPMTDALRAELPEMLREHEAIAASAQRLARTAREANNARVEALALALQRHARSEEEILYPAAILVGDLVRARAPATR